MRDCATGGSNFYDTGDADLSSGAFESIANSVVELPLTKLQIVCLRVPQS